MIGVCVSVKTLATILLLSGNGVELHGHTVTFWSDGGRLLVLTPLATERGVLWCELDVGRSA